MADTTTDALIASTADRASVAANKTRTPSTTLGKDDFLKLLLTQMQYQDPLNPQSDTDFIAQMAQFSSLEQVQNLNQTMSQGQAYSMIGKLVAAYSYDSSTGVTTESYGYVESVIVRNGEARLVVDGKEVSLADVEYVSQDYYEAQQLQNIYQSMNTSQNLSLIGKYIQAITADSEGKASEFIEGKVDYVKFVNGELVFMVNNKEIYASEVASVAEEKLLIGKKITISTTDPESGEPTETTGTINNVTINGDKAHLVVDGQNVAIDKINYATESLRLVGQQITSGSVSGVVESVVMNGGTPYLRVKNADGETTDIAYTAYKGISANSDSE